MASKGRTHKAKSRPQKKKTGRNNGPARQRYWRSGRLEESKVYNLMRYNGMTRAAAIAYWRIARQGRMK
jgi:hypothetical protein